MDRTEAGCLSTKGMRLHTDTCFWISWVSSPKTNALRSFSIFLCPRLSALQFWHSRRPQIGPQLTFPISVATLFLCVDFLCKYPLCSFPCCLCFSLHYSLPPRFAEANHASFPNHKCIFQCVLPHIPLA